MCHLLFSFFVFASLGNDVKSPVMPTEMIADPMVITGMQR